MSSFLILIFALCGMAIVEGRLIRVSSILTPPYLMKSTLGNYEGMIVDILDKVFPPGDENTYNITEIDQKYGHKIGDQWDGVIGSVHRGLSDLAAAPLTVNEDRETVVAFSKPFQEFNFAVLMTTQAKLDHQIHTMNDLAKQSDIKVGIIKEGSTNAFFRSSNEQPYKKLYTTMSGDPDESFLASHEDGVNKIRSEKGKFAMIIEDTTARYWASKSPCDLSVVHNEDTTYHGKYAFAMRKDNIKLKKRVDDAIERMKQGDLKKIEDKWWKQKSDCNAAVRTISTGFGILVALITFFF